jgi:hypothetical protein
VSGQPPGVHARRLPILLIRCGGGGRRPIACLTESLHLVGDTIPQIGVSSMGRPRIMTTSYSITVISPDGKWNMWVFGCHRSLSAVNVAASISDRPRVMSRASGRNPARRINDSYHSSHIKGMCMRILSGFKRY